MDHAVIVLAVLLMMSVTEQQQQDEMVPSDFENEACKESLSTIIANTSDHKHSIKNKKIHIAVLENQVQNLMAQIQVMKDTCTGFVPLDCCQIMIASNLSVITGLYEIKDPCAGDRAFNYGKIHVRCDMETDGGGWIVIQRRIANGTVNFYRNWEDYVNGFGDVDGEFWIGLKNMNELTKQGVELQVTVWNDNEMITWNYPYFSVGSAESIYHLSVSGGNGDGNIDGLALSNGCPFTTFDHSSSYSECASTSQAGWWFYGYGICCDANLNGRHESSGLPEDSVARLYWGTIGNTFANSEMKIRSKTCGLGG